MNEPLLDSRSRRKQQGSSCEEHQSNPQLPAPNSSRRRRPLSIWELPEQLLTSVHRFRRRVRRKGRERRHYAAILAFVYRNRFVTASQVQRRFSQFLKSDRTARRHLAEMQESLGYLNLVPTPSPLWPKVYAISGRGMNKLRQSLAKQGKATESHTAISERRRQYSMQHVVHELFVTEFMLSVWEAAQNSAIIELLNVQRRSLVKHPAFQLPASRGRLIPDGMFLVRSRAAGMICTFLEIDTGSMNPRQMEEKFRAYADWSDSANGRDFLVDLYRRHGAANPRPTFRIAVACGGRVGVNVQSRMQALLKSGQKLSSVTRNRLWFTTTSELSCEPKRENLFAVPIWHRSQVEGARDQLGTSFI